jgi:hypothetical protein
MIEHQRQDSKSNGAGSLGIVEEDSFAIESAGHGLNAREPIIQTMPFGL